MSRHVTNWLGGYLDGELKGLRLRRVEAHVAQCAACRGEVEALRDLVALLKESPPVEGLTPSERFAAQIELRLSPRPERPATERALEMSWRLVPIGLLAAWAFVQTVFIVAGMVQMALWTGLGGDVAAGLLPGSERGWWLSDLFRLPEASLSDAAQILLEFVRGGGPLGWAPAIYAVLLVLIGLLYWSWLASWWALHKRSRLGIPNSTGQ
jgi:anti-sigma factor RsiW